MTRCGLIVRSRLSKPVRARVRGVGGKAKRKREPSPPAGGGSLVKPSRPPPTLPIRKREGNLREKGYPSSRRNRGPPDLSSQNGGIRTHDLSVPNGVLYHAELHSEDKKRAGYKFLPREHPLPRILYSATFLESGWEDSNLRLLGSKPSTLNQTELHPVSGCMGPLPLSFGQQQPRRHRPIR